MRATRRRFEVGKEVGKTEAVFVVTVARAGRLEGIAIRAPTFVVEGDGVTALFVCRLGRGLS